MSTALTTTFDLGGEIELFDPAFLGEVESFQDDAGAGINPLTVLPLLKMAKPPGLTATSSTFDITMGGQSLLENPVRSMYFVIVSWFGACSLWPPGDMNERKESGDNRPRCFTTFQDYSKYMRHETVGSFREYEGDDDKGKVVLSAPEVRKCATCEYRAFDSAKRWDPDSKSNSRAPAASRSRQLFVCQVIHIGSVKGPKGSMVDIYELDETVAPFLLLTLSNATNGKSWDELVKEFHAKRGMVSGKQLPMQGIVWKATVGAAGGTYNNAVLKTEFAGLLDPRANSEMGLTRLRTHTVPAIQDLVEMARASGIVTSEMDDGEVEVGTVPEREDAEARREQPQDVPGGDTWNNQF